MRVLVLGGDGFCGWPTALHLSAEGWDVTIVDNLSRRNIDNELEVQSLTPIRTMGERIKAWKDVSGRDIGFVNMTVGKEFDRLVALIRDFAPDSVVHFAEQRAAPYSMKSARHKLYTVDNNINGTHNILCAIVESGLDVHLVHLGTMGVYGYGTAGLSIPEGYLTVRVDVDGVDRAIEIPYPPHPGSIYHMTKTLDALLFYYYNKNDDVRITDLHQGVVWGTNTEETLLHPDLINRFDWEGDYGTVLNRFLVDVPEVRFRTLPRAESEDGQGGIDEDLAQDGVDYDLARWILNAQTGGTVAHRIATLPLLVDGELVELDVALFEQSADREPSQQHGLRHREVVLALSTEALGRVEIHALLAGGHVRVQIVAGDSGTTQFMSTHAERLAAELQGIGWQVDELRYETRAANDANGVVRSLVEHVISPGSVSRLV